MLPAAATPYDNFLKLFLFNVPIFTPRYCQNQTCGENYRADWNVCNVEVVVICIRVVIVVSVDAFTISHRYCLMSCCL